jgi:hypothetical protein
MAQTTNRGGHWYDTAAEPQPLSVASSMLLEDKAKVAYRAYLDHRPGCARCQQSLFICQEAKGLWEAFKAAKGDG